MNETASEQVERLDQTVFSARVDIDYALGQLRCINQSACPSRTSDRVQRAIDTLERAAENLAQTD